MLTSLGMLLTFSLCMSLHVPVPFLITFCSEVAGRNLPRMNTLPVELSAAENVGSNSNHLKLQRSKSERNRHNNRLAKETAQIFDDKVSAQQKV